VTDWKQAAAMSNGALPSIANDAAANQLQ